MTPEQKLHKDIREIKEALEALRIWRYTKVDPELKANNKAIFTIMGKLNETDYKQSVDKDD